MERWERESPWGDPAKFCSENSTILNAQTGRGGGGAEQEATGKITRPEVASSLSFPTSKAIPGTSCAYSWRYTFVHFLSESWKTAHSSQSSPNSHSFVQCVSNEHLFRARRCSCPYAPGAPVLINSKNKQIKCWGDKGKTERLGLTCTHYYI